MASDYWMAELTGDENHLDWLKRWYADEAVKVIREDSHWFLAGTFLFGCNTADEVTQKAEAKLELMKAAALLESTSEPLKVKVSGAAYIDQSGNRCLECKMEAISRVVASIQCFGNEHPSLPHRALMVAESDEHLDMALRLWGEPSRSWPRLYRIVEDISLSLKARTSRKYHISKVLHDEGLIASVDDCRRFLYSACEATVAGRDSRHALGNNQSHAEYEPMKHAEAVKFVGALLGKTLRLKWDRLEESLLSAPDHE
jgi:hypothetical protein